MVYLPKEKLLDQLLRLHGRIVPLAELNEAAGLSCERRAAVIYARYRVRTHLLQVRHRVRWYS